MATKKTLATIVLLGDVMLGRIVDEALTVMPNPASIWGDTLPLLCGAATPDGSPERCLVAGNLECAVTEYSKPAPKTFNFKLSPQNIGALTDAQFKFVSLANNHCLDYYELGLLETQNVLSNHEIAWSGAGKTAKEASQPAIVEQSGTNIAFLSYSDHYKEWAATENKIGINFIDPESYSKSVLQKQLKNASEQADLVIIFIHWGPNWAWHPSKAIQQLAHDFIDLGGEKIAAVFGHSAHHIQGIELRAGKPIIYAAGGFIDDYALDEQYRNDLGFMYCLHLDDPGKEGLSSTSTSSSTRPVTPALRELELIPTKITHEWRQPLGSARPPYFSYVNRATGEDKAWLWKKVKTLSAEFGTRVLEGGPRGFRIPLKSF
jgi:poly-gamma-glutamate capsule biosynthesis protein CapA/YwtB (metallophosphatase superfamily)